MLQTNNVHSVDVHFATLNESQLTKSNKWHPIAPLLRTDADVTMMYLSAPEIRFATPVNDPWITATKPASEIHNIDTKKTFSAYVQNEPLGVLACAMQMQYCNPNLPAGQNCEPLRGVKDPRATAAVKKVFPDQTQFDVLKWANNLWIGQAYLINSMVGFIGSSSLLMRYGNSFGYQGPLPDNQWQLESEHWVKGLLASLQDAFVTVANGFPEKLEIFRQEPAANASVAWNMCKNQKVVSTAFSSFNVLGISLILILGSFIIVTDMALEPAVAWWQRRGFATRRLKDQFYGEREAGNHPLYSVLEWSHTSTLQLQRLAHEEAGYGTWTSCDGDTPVTYPGEHLAPMDLSDIKHPVLKEHGSKKVEEEWGGIVAAKPFGLRRSDTGLETLVEEMEEEKAEKKINEEMDMIVTTIVSREEPARPQTPGEPDWRRLR